MSGLLSIAMEHSRECLWVGKHFFLLLVLPADSPLIGLAIEPPRIPGAFGSWKRD
jgi:hypothetical protein